MSEAPARPTVLEIDLDAAAHNVRVVRQLVGPERKIFAVIKAGGYGFGAAEMGAVFARNGADWLGLADLAEGIRLRQRGISTPILVYPNSLPAAAADALAHNLVPTLVDLDSARAYSEAASGPCEFFVKVDVGLERLGVPAEQAVKTIRAMLDLPHLRLAGICAHPHADSGDDSSYADWQLARFTPVIDELEAQGVRVPVRLLAATPFVLRFPHTYLNAVDPGRMLYGVIMPGETSPIPLRPAFRARQDARHRAEGADAARALRRPRAVPGDSADEARRGADRLGGRHALVECRPRARARAVGADRQLALARAHGSI